MQTNETRWTSAVFRILSSTMNIDKICEKINITPTRYHEKGELYSKRNPKSKDNK